MKSTTAAALIALLTTLGCSTPDAESAPPSPLADEVAVTGGVVRGIVAGEHLRVYHRIPFAAAPLGERRWAPPAPVEPWDGVRDASAPGPSCPQTAGIDGGFYSADPGEISEDCLTLNVWTEATRADERRPVMVWVHGGALVTGGGAEYPGDLLASKGVVLVTINYRLGPFGFLAHPELATESAAGVSGNQGLRDQIAALEWVRDNIASFGGDPGNVTIFGESAGSLSMSLLQASPHIRGLIHRVIGESGGAFQPMTYRTRATAWAQPAEDLGARFGEVLVGGKEEPTLANMRAASMDRVLETFNSDPAFSNYDSLAIVDGEIIPREVAAIFADGEQADVPVLIGSNSDEGTTFLPYFEPLFGEGVDGFKAYATATLGEASDDLWAAYPATDAQTARRSWVDLFSDAIFAYPMRAWARSMENVKSPAYLYWFTWEPPVAESEKYRSFHAGEIGYVFGNLTLFGAQPTEADRTFSHEISDIWVRFATTGDPNGGGLPEWPAYTRDNEAYMELGETIAAGTDLRLEQMSLIERAWGLRRGADAAAGGTGR